MATPTTAKISPPKARPSKMLSSEPAMRRLEIPQGTCGVQLVLRSAATHQTAENGDRRDY